MSYTQSMAWQRTHRRGTKQPVIMSTRSGFWPSYGFLSECYWPYVAKCRAEGDTPMSSEDYYNHQIKG